jgi:nicotinamidase-related amidase
MMAFDDININSAALLLMHFQVDVFALLFAEEKPPLLDQTNMLIASWRSTGRPVIFANFALGANYEAACDRNRLVSNLTATGRFREPKPVAGLGIAPGDSLYSCPRVNVFFGTSLHADLQAQGIDTLVMAGVTSSGVVLSSLSWASDADYRIHLVRSCCHDPDNEVHEGLFRTGFATRAIII